MPLFLQLVRALVCRRPFPLQASIKKSVALVPANHFSVVRRATVRRTPTKKSKDEAAIYTRHIISSIYNTLKYASWLEARDRLSTLGVKWDSHIVNRVLKAHPPMEKAWLFFNWASRIEGFKHDHFTFTTMLDIFGEAGRIKSMLYVFEKMREKKVRVDAVTYTSLVHWLSRSGDVDAAMQIWEQMKRNDCFPTVVSYTVYMKMLLDNGRTDEAAQVYKEMIEDGIPPTCVTYTVVMDYLFASGKFNEAMKIFGEMQGAGVKPDKATCNILIERCCKSNNTTAITRILCYMRDNRLVLRYPVFLEALRALQNAGENDDLLREVNPHFPPEESSDDWTSDDDLEDTVLILYLLRTKKFKAVDSMIFHLKERKNFLKPWVVSDIIELNRTQEGAILAFQYSLKMNIPVERRAILSLIGASLKASVADVADIAEEVVRAGYSLGAYLATLLLFRLGSAGRRGCAERVFRLLRDDQKCAAVYTAMICAHFRGGDAAQALAVFEQMKQNGVQPSLGTYNVVLGGLLSSGMLREAEQFLREKKRLLRGYKCLTSGQKMCDLVFDSESLAVELD